MTINEWILFGKTGSSSLTMWGVVSGTLNNENIKKFRVEIPYDRDDFSRCFSFWKQCNLSDEQLQEIKELLPIWKPFIENWYKLVKMYKDQEPMYDFIQTLVEKGRLNAGWVKIDKYTWKSNY